MAVNNRAMRFALGTGVTQQTCTGTTTASGKASCTIYSAGQPQGASNTVPVTVVFGDDDHNPSSTSTELGLTSATRLDSTVVRRLANGTLAQHAGGLVDFGGDAVPGHSARVTLGTGEDQ